MEEVDHHARDGYQVEYALSGRSSCKRCGGNIQQDAIRIGSSAASPFHDGFDTTWSHLHCNKHNARLTSYKALKGFALLRWADMEKVAAVFGEKLPTDAATMKAKAENEATWAMREQLVEAKLKPKQLQELLVANGSADRKRQASSLFGKAADLLVRGRIGKCPTCQNFGELYFNSFVFICNGSVSAYTRCDFKGTAGIERYKATIPESLAKTKFFKSFKFPSTHSKKKWPFDDGGDSESLGVDDEEVLTALATTTTTTTATKKKKAPAAKKKKRKKDEDDDDDEAAAAADGPFKGMVVAVAGTKKSLGVDMTPKELSELVVAMGGATTKKAADASVVVAGEDDYNKTRAVKLIADAKKARVPVVTAAFVTGVESRAAPLRTAAAAADAGLLLSPRADVEGKPLIKLDYDTKEALRAAKRARKQTERVKQRIRPQPLLGSDLMNVDPKFHKGSAPANASILCVYKEDWGYVAYHAMLSLTDISHGLNKFYRLAVLKADTRYWFAIHWGRTGDDKIDDYRVYDCETQADAIKRFEEKFKDKTGNTWADRDVFDKKPGLYNLIHLDDGTGAGDDDMEDDEESNPPPQ